MGLLEIMDELEMACVKALECYLDLLAQGDLGNEAQETALPLGIYINSRREAEKLKS